MNDRKNATLEFPEQVCPKRPWVLATLSDDEALGPKGELPTGLAFHLRQCDSCRLVADQLLLVTSELGHLAALSVADTLCRKGDARVEQALRDGARLTGRFVTPDLEESALPRGRFPLGALRWPLSAAAVLLIGVGVASWFSTNHGQPHPTAIASSEPVWPFDDDVFGDVARSETSEDVRNYTFGSPDTYREDTDARKITATKLANASTVRRQRRTRRPIVWYSSHIEAAMHDAPGAVQAAVVMPRRRNAAHRTNWRELFDRPGRFLFTTLARDKE